MANNRTIITVVGTDHAGIIAAVCTYFAKNDINILNLTMSTVEEFINMMMIVDLSNYKKPFPKLAEDLNAVGKKVGCSIHAQHEDIFNMMHRI